MKEMCIYLIQNTVNNKKYIGQTIKNISIRFSQHISDAKANRHNMILHKSIRKYGKENFIIWVLEYCETQEDLNKTEAFYIDYFKTFNRNFGYNTRLIDLNGGCRNSLETISKIKANPNIKLGGRKSRGIAKNKYCGIRKINNLWNSRISLGKYTKDLGCYLTEEEAAKAYDIAALKYVGINSKLNFPELKEKYLNNEILLIQSKNSIYNNIGKYSKIKGVIFNKSNSKWIFSWKKLKQKSSFNKKDIEEYAINILKKNGYLDYE